MGKIGKTTAPIPLVKRSRRWPALGEMRVTFASRTTAPERSLIRPRNAPVTTALCPRQVEVRPRNHDKLRMMKRFMIGIQTGKLERRHALRLGNTTSLGSNGSTGPDVRRVGEIAADCYEEMRMM